MIERTSAYETIKGHTAAGDKSLATVPITRNSNRVFKLMQEDSIELHFTLSEALPFPIGSFIDDELFGRFYVIDEQMPQYNESNSGYDYQLKFWNQYWLWRNHMFKMCTLSGKRKEDEWTLTAPLYVHVEEFLKNLVAIGFSYGGYPYIAEYDKPNISKYNEAINISYSGTNLIAALNKFASSFECEWWVTYGTMDGHKQGVVHFGKCSTRTTQETFELGINVKSMSISKDTQSFANRIYAYGGTQNLPSSYRKKLQPLKVESIESGYYIKTTNGYESAMLFSLADNRKLDMSMFGTYELTSTLYPNGKVLQGSIVESKNVYSLRHQSYWGWHDIPSKVRIAFSQIITINNNSTENEIDDLVIKPVLSVQTDSDSYFLCYLEEFFAGHFDIGETKNITAEIDEEAVVNIPKECVFSNYVRFAVHVFFDRKAQQDGKPYPMCITADVNCYPVGSDNEPVIEVSCNKLASSVIVQKGNSKYNANVRNCYYTKSTIDGQMEYIRKYGTFISLPDSFAVGDEFTILTQEDGGNLVSSLIPESWYLDEGDDPTAEKSISERRLFVPDGEEEYAGDEFLAPQVVEESVVFENIFPKMCLFVGSIKTRERTVEEELSDGTKQKWVYSQYTISLKDSNDDHFPFSKDYILVGETLRIKFITPEDMAEITGKAPEAIDSSLYKLAGMTFDVKYKASDEYVIIPNSDYGAQFPNDNLCPAIDSPVILLGWNTAAIGKLGLIRDAERNLLAKRTEYSDALKAGQFTFDCNMMSGWFTEQRRAVFKARDVKFRTSDGYEIMTGIGSGDYFLLKEGDNVKIIHSALGIDKESRIIGYRMKLDIPYDEPEYTVGETEAYSRIRKIEKELTKLQA